MEGKVILCDGVRIVRSRLLTYLQVPTGNEETMQVELRDQTFKENFRKMVGEDVLTTVVTSQKDLDGTS